MHQEHIQDQHPQTVTASFLEHQVVVRLTATGREQDEHHLEEHLDTRAQDNKVEGDHPAQEDEHTV